jgi:hypothetical protein
LGDQLGRLEGQLRRHGAPVLDFVKPGLSPDHVDAALAPVLGRPAPSELITWFGWHNGTPRSTDPLLAVLGPVWSYYDLQTCVAIYQSEWDFANEVVESGLFDRPEEYWAQSWFPLLIADRNILVVDTAAETPHGLPVGMRYKEGFDPPTEDLLLPDLVEIWVNLWENDHYYLENRHLRLDKEHLPPELRPLINYI